MQILGIDTSPLSNHAARTPQCGQRLAPCIQLFFPVRDTSLAFAASFRSVQLFHAAAGNVAKKKLTAFQGPEQALGEQGSFVVVLQITVDIHGLPRIHFAQSLISVGILAFADRM